MQNRTASVPGYYVEFQANVLRQLPRPEEIDQTTAEGWSKNQKALKEALRKALVLPIINRKIEHILQGPFQVDPSLKSIDKIFYALRRGLIQFSDDSLTENILCCMPIDEVGAIYLDVVSTDDLGLCATTTIGKLRDEAKNRGSEFCPAVLAPQLRLQYTHQPEGEWLIVVTEPIIGRAKIPCMLAIGHGPRGLQLMAVSCRDGYLKTYGRRLIFIRPARGLI